MVTPYITVSDAESLIEFLKATFDAHETIRHAPGDGRLHAEVELRGSMLMIGSGPKVTQPRLATLHIYVDDPDATYARALQAGAKSMGAPEDRPYGERSGYVSDALGNIYFIAKRFGTHPGPEGAAQVLPYLFPRQAHPYIGFLERAFGAQRMEIFEHDGRVMHAGVRLGDSIVELGEAHEDVPTHCAFLLYVPSVDEFHARAIAAGGKPIVEPHDRPGVHRFSVVEDPCGYLWTPATPL